MAGKSNQYNKENKDNNDNKNEKREYKNEGNFPEKVDENEKGELEGLLC